MDFELTTANIGTLLLDGSAIALIAGVIVETSIMRKRNRSDDKLFFLLLVMNIFLALSDIVTYLSDQKSFPGARYFNMGGISVFYMILVLMVMVWLHYCLLRFKGVGGTGGKKYIGFFIPGLVMEALLVINFFSGIIFYVDENNIYHRSYLFVPMFILLGFYVFAGFYLIGRYRVGDGKKSLIPIWIYLIPLVVGMVIPFVLGGVSLGSIGIAMSIVFTHLGSASEMVNVDVDGGEIL